MTRLQATVICERAQQDIDPTEIGMGDRLLVCLNAQIAVNGSVGGEKEIKVNESLLTSQSDSILSGETVWFFG